MTKVDLINALSSHADMSKAQATKAVDALATVVAESLNSTGKALIPGICKLELVHRNARTGRNPQTGETVEIPAQRAAKFKALKALKDALV